MCVISGPVISVNSTKILCLPSKNGTRQLTVYRNAVATPESNAMCLPCPNPATIEFESVPKDIFSQCSSSFGFRMARGTLSAAGGSNSKSLPILSHGSYEVVIVPSMNHFSEIPEGFATLTPEVVSFLRGAYPPHFGVVLCKLKKGSTDYEPFAYSHKMQASAQLFFPTKHFHMEAPGASHRDTSFYADEPEVGWASAFTSPMRWTEMSTSPSVNTRFADDWDHELYSAGTPNWCHESHKKEMMSTNQIDWSKMPSDFRLGSSAVLRCKEIVGHSANVDIEMPMAVA